MIGLYICCSVRIDGKQGYFPGTLALIESEGIKRDLLAGTTIIVDRYVYSGVAFSAAKVSNSVLELMKGIGL
jgi:hypothetical protein